MSTRPRLVGSVLAVAVALGAALSAGAGEPSVQLRLGGVPVAELGGDAVDPLWDEPTMIAYLEAALAGADDPRLHVPIASATIERDGGHFFLVGRGKGEAGRCVTPSIRLDAVAGSAAAAAIRFVRVETCVSDNCPGCLAQRDEEGHIQYCYCMPAGDCEKVVLWIPIPF